MSRKASLRFIPGSHRIGKPLQQIAAERGVARGDRTADVALAWASEVQADAEIVSPDMADGDVLLFDGRLWHGSLNEGERTRRALLLQYAAAGQDVRIPTDQGFDWPFAFTDKLAPVIRVLSTATAGEQAFGTPAPFPPETALAEPFASRIVPAPNGHPWKAHHLFRGQTAHVDRLAALSPI